MKTLLLACLLAGVPGVASVDPDRFTCAAYDDYVAGYRAGWAAGYKKVHGPNALPPVCPVPPVPYAGRDSYNDGFADGVLAGMSAG